jgi:hypothetical protein
VWLGSEEAGDVTGRMFEVGGGVISLATGWRHGPRVDRGRRWEPAELDDAVKQLLADSPPPEPVYGSG